MHRCHLFYIDKIYYSLKRDYLKMSSDKINKSLNEEEWQIILDSLSNTIFNEEIKEDVRKKAKNLFLKLQKEITLSSN